MRKIYKLLRLFWTPKCKHRWIEKRTRTVMDGFTGQSIAYFKKMDLIIFYYYM